MASRTLGLLLLLSLSAGCSASSPPGTLPDRPVGIRVHQGAPVVTLDARSKGPVVSADVYGAEIATWYDFRQPWVARSLEETGIHVIRWPGGSESDAYHWENGGTLCAYMGYITPGATFDNFMHDVTARVGSDTSVTLNYGSNRTCNGGGDPSEAGAWVAHAKSSGDHVSYWTVGNEVYGSWEYDLHAKPNDPATYADAVRTGYYPAVKGADSSVSLGVVGDFDQSGSKTWNDVVFRQSGPFDFVEIHYYPQYNTDSDAFLLGSAIDNFEKMLASLRTEMTRDGLAPTMPLYLGEYNNDAGNEGKQSVSIVNGLYLGQMLGAVQAAGVSRATWWLAYGSCDQNGDFSSSLYGFQHFGSEGLFSDGLPDSYEGCSKTPTIAGGTPFPTARVMALYARTVPGGTSVRTTVVPVSLRSSVRAYGYAVGKSYAFMFFNDTLSTVDVVARIGNAGNAFTAAQTTYGAAQYDESRENRWVGPVTKQLGSVSASVPLSLPPYSVTALTLK